MQRGVRVFEGGEIIPDVWDAEIARRVLATWAKSGESGSGFARSRGFHPAKLFFWKKKLGGGAASSTDRTATFLELSAPTGTRVVATPVPTRAVSAMPTDDGALEIVCGTEGPVAIRVHGKPDVSALRAVLDAIRGPR